MLTKLKKIYAALAPHEQRLLLAAALVFVAGTIALGVVVLNATTKPVPARGGEYTEGLFGQPTYANPVLATSDTDRALVRLLFSRVTDVAEKIESDASGRSWKIRLKEGLVWSDGEKLTSDDILFTVERIQDPDAQSPFFSMWQGVAASRVSELELQFNLVSPYAFFSDTLAALFILPRHVYGDIPSANWRLSDFNLKPVSSGMYVFDSYEKESSGFITRYHLRANPHGGGERPFIQSVTFNFYPKQDDVVQAFNGGHIDGFLDVNQESEGVVNRPHENVALTSPSYYAVFWNQSQNLALKDVAVRAALETAVDRNELIAAVFNGRAHARISPVESEASATTTSTGQTGIERAKQILDGAGWNPGGSGTREKQVKKSTLKLDFTLTVPRVPFLVATANNLLKTWEAIGARVSLNIIAPEDAARGAVRNRDYQAILFGNSANPPDDLYPFWHSNERFYPGLNLALYSNKQADALLEAIRREPNRSVREEKLSSLTTIIANDHAALFLYSPQYLYILSRSVRGVPGGFITESANRFQNMQAWYLKTTRALK